MDHPTVPRTRLRQALPQRRRGGRGQRYAISHRAGEGSGPEAPPVHVISFRYDLDRAIAAGAGSGGTGQLSPLRISPHGLVQDYLNRTDHLWGVVTNGRRLRLLRDNLNLSRAAFVEFDLETMLEEGIYADFVLLYLLLHRTRLASPGVAPRACWLEQWREDAVARGTRALDTLREGVEAAIRSLGQGLLEHPGNETLRARLMNGRLTGEGYYRQLLRLVYRLLFLLAAEERDLLFPPGAAPEQRSLYTDHYSIGRLRELVGRRRAADRHDDLWRSLLVTFAMLRDEDGGGDRIGLPSLGGGLFDADACSDLDGALVANERLLAAIRGLAFAKDSKTGLTRRVNYRDMDVEELGSVYEGLLELQPVLRTAGERPEFSLGASGERKSTGSYYTNAGLVRELIASALDPVIAAALARGKTREEQRANLLALKICDPACGSGHFLLAAARRLGRELARLTQEEAEPDPMAVRATTRLVIARCIYGVDRNPLAVDLCKLALWLEGHEAGRPLSFLEAHIKWGNSLVGATNELMEGGIPDAAFEPVTGDDKKIASIVRRDNKKQSKDQYPLGSSVCSPQDKGSTDPLFC
ncbi:MAG: DNA methyltransferase [Chloroflexia bacterium]